jgi:signal transduction histidine kinase
MTVARSALIAAGIAALGVATLAVATVLDLDHGGPHDETVLAIVGSWIPALTCAVLGFRVVQRVPANPVGWILVSMTAIGGITTLGEVIAYDGLVRHTAPHGLAVAGVLISFASWLLAFGPLGYLILLFPDAQPASQRWRRFPLLMGIVLAGAWVGATVQPGVMSDQFGKADNPLGIAAADRLPGGLIIGAFMVANLGCLIACCVSAVLRFRRSAGEHRVQLRWLGYVAVVVPFGLAMCFVSDAVSGSHLGGEIFLPIALTVIPAALALAVLRYRIYDLDHLISRTVTWALLSLVVGGAFVGASLVVGVVSAHGSSVPTAVATLVAVAVLWWLRRPVQGLVDRRFDRATLHGLAVVDDYLSGLRTGVARPADIATVLGRALGEDDVTIIFVGSDGVLRDADGDELPPPAEDGAPISVGPQAGPIALISRQPLPPADSHRVRTVVERLRVGLEIVRARSETAAHLREVEASRTRLVHAGDEERRRLERDLHDGAQQRLVALGVGVRRLQRSLPAEAMILRPAFDQVVDDIAAAVADLRRLAAGLRPARLDDGIGAALEDLVRTTPVPVRLVVTGERPEPSVETAAYFVACEGITNAVKHADAASIDLVAARVDGAFVVSVVDDGVGGARLGSGLAGLQDRVAAHGGTLHLDSRPGAGTRLEAVLPCGS